MKKALLFVLLSISMIGCTPKKTGPDPWVPPDPAPRDYIDERDYGYTCYLDKPSDVVHNSEDLKAICDYYAFYKKEEFSITVADDYQYSVVGENTLKSELNYLYWNSELINGVMGMNAIQANKNKWDFTYTIYRNAYKDSYKFFKNGTDVFYKCKEMDESNQLVFATDNNELPICDVATTQQLFYAAEHNYRVRCIPTSPAEKYYNLAKQLLNLIIDDEYTELEKFSTIYDYVLHSTTYDYRAAYESSDEPENPSLYPDVFCSGYKCFFLEGFFDNHLVVCDGFAKVMTLLGKMLGINIVRASGINDKRFSSREAAGHAYNFVEIEGDWYLSDITWGQSTTYDNVKVTNHNYFLTSHNAIYPYTSIEWPDIQRVMYQEVEGFESELTLKQYASQTFEIDGKTYPRTMTKDNFNDFDLGDILKDETYYLEAFVDDDVFRQMQYSENYAITYRSSIGEMNNVVVYGL